MKFKIQRLVKIVCSIVLIMMVLSGCQTTTTKQDKPLTVYLWDTCLIEDLAPYIHEKFPDKDIEFIAGNNDTDLYSYLSEHGELPDIITVRRYAGTDAKDLLPYLMDFSSYDIVSEYSSYSLQYYRNSDGEIKWLPICGIPQTIIANKTLFDEYGLDLPESYEDYVKACQTFYDNGIKPYALDLAQDWSSHEMIQTGGIGELTSLDGILWRANAESANGEISFDDELWTNIFKETNNLLKDSYFTSEDLTYDTSTAMNLFVSGKAAMFHGSPEHLRQCQEQMSDELVRIPYFAQNSSDGYIYMTPSIHIAFNKNLEEDEERLESALDILECMISREGQKIIANGSSVISFNPNVNSSIEGMTGLEDEIENNSYYIRYASQKSFSASVKAVKGLLSGEMDEKEAYETFKSVINSNSDDNSETITFDADYSISLNDNDGRDAPSLILTSVKDEYNADLAFAPYYHFTSSIYKGECKVSRVNLMIANSSSSSSSLYLTKLTGSQVKELVNSSLINSVDGFKPLTKYELPIASGMKMLIESNDNGFVLKDILVNDESIDENKQYSIMLTDGVISILNTMGIDYEILDDDLASAWVNVASNNKLASVQDYIELSGD